MDSSDLSSHDEIRFLKEKIEAGADFVLTQLFYDVDGFLTWEKQCRSMGIVCPIIPGVMPIQSYNGFRRITNLAKIRIPADVALALDPIKVIIAPSIIVSDILDTHDTEPRPDPSVNAFYRMTTKKSRTMAWN